MWKGSRRRPWSRWAAGAALAGAVLFGAAVWIAHASPHSDVRRLVRRLDWAIAGGTIRGALLGRPPVEEQHLDLPPAAPDAHAWAAAEPFIVIAHRFGASLASDPNTLGALDKGLARGFRIFEVDLVLTADGRLVCHHGTSEAQRDRLRYTDYVALMERTGRSGCTFADLVELAHRNEEIRFVLDIKNRFDESYREIRSRLRGTGLGRRFIPQIYHISQARVFREAPFFAGVIFTGYRSTSPPDRIIDHARAAGIRVVALPVYMLDEWSGALPDDLTVLTHPVNNRLRAIRLRDRGIDGIYTQDLSPRIVPDTVATDSSPRPSPAERPISDGLNVRR